MERNGTKRIGRVYITPRNSSGTVGTGYMLHKCFFQLVIFVFVKVNNFEIIIAISYCTVMKVLKSVVVLFLLYCASIYLL